jgi:hypothetical protein
MAMKDLVKKIFSDEATKARFMTDPESVMSEFALTKDEKKAVTTTFAHLGTSSSSSATLNAAVLDSWT